MRIFLAGSTGVIGRELLPLLTERGHEVVALTRREEEVPRLRSAGVEPAVADVFDAEGLRSVVAKARPEAVVHELTSLPDVFDHGRIAEQFAANNRIRREGTRNLLSSAKAAGARKIVAQSIAFGYKPVGSRIKTEEAPLFVDAPEPWGGSVRAVKDLEEAVLDAEGIEGVALRYGHLYGPGTYFAPDGQIGRGVLAGVIPIAGEGEGTYSFLHVEDAASATVAAVEGCLGVSTTSPTTSPPAHGSGCPTTRKSWAPGSLLGSPRVNFWRRQGGSRCTRSPRCAAPQTPEPANRGGLLSTGAGGTVSRTSLFAGSRHRP